MKNILKRLVLVSFFCLYPFCSSPLWAISVPEILETLNQVLGGSDKGLEMLMSEQQALKNRSQALQTLSTELKLSLMELQSQFSRMKEDLSALESRYLLLRTSFEEYKTRESQRIDIILAVLGIEAIALVIYFIVSRKEK